MNARYEPFEGMSIEELEGLNPLQEPSLAHIRNPWMIVTCAAGFLIVGLMIAVDIDDDRVNRDLRNRCTRSTRRIQPVHRAPRLIARKAA